MKLAATFLLFITAAIMLSCNANTKDKEAKTFNEVSMDDYSFSTTQSIAFNGNSSAKMDITPTLNEHEKKIIRRATVQMETANLSTTKAFIDKVARQFNAEITNEEFSSESNYKQFQVKIRIPSQQFSALLTTITQSNNTTITYQKVYNEDVTEEYYDLTMRLANKRKYLERYRQLLAKANNVTEIIEIEEKIRYLEEELESAEGRIKYLNDQVDFSTINLTIVQKIDSKASIKRDSFGKRFTKSLSDGFNSITTTFLWLVKQWFYLLASIALFFVFKKWRKAAKAKK